MKYFLLFVPFFMYAQTYMSKVEPRDEFVLYAQSSGKVVLLDKADEMRVVDKVIMEIDAALEQKELALYKEKLALYREKLAINEKNYKKFIMISGKSTYDKDEKYLSLVDLRLNIKDLELSIAQVSDTLAKKSLHVKNLYIKSFAIDKGEYVSAGTKVATAYDISSAKLVVYVNEEDYKDIEQKKVLIDGKEGIATITKIDKTVDETFISAHKVELALQSESFGKTLSVEFVK